MGRVLRAPPVLRPPACPRLPPKAPRLVGAGSQPGTLRREVMGRRVAVALRRSDSFPSLPPRVWSRRTWRTGLEHGSRRVFETRVRDLQGPPEEGVDGSPYYCVSEWKPERSRVQPSAPVARTLLSTWGGPGHPTAQCVNVTLRLHITFGQGKASDPFVSGPLQYLQSVPVSLLNVFDPDKDPERLVDLVTKS